MNGGLTYFQKKSPYPGDRTNNASLMASDMDNNFFNLEGRDIQSAEVEGRDIVLIRMNGDRIVCPNAIPSNHTVSSINFDEKRGILTYTVGNEEKEVYLGTAHSTAVDNTLSGNGTKANPVSIARNMRTGQYRPVLKIVTGALDEARHCHGKYKPGDRILTIEGISDYGMLYNYNAVQKIACELQTANSPWRIPSKADWDDMLNAVEPCPDDRNHEIGTANRCLGHWAGKLLKSVDLWRTKEGCDYHHKHDEDFPIFAMEPEGNCMPSPCMGDMHCGAVSKPHPHPTHEPKPTFHGGLDKYGFRVTPAGAVTDDACNFLHFSERAIFWTATNIKGRNVYIKQFMYDNDDVMQDIAATGKYFSLRLVKDYNGSNFSASEEILGQSYPTVLMPSKNKGAAIWTAVNIAYNNCNLRALAPNNGLDLSETTHFFINEWDGDKWLRNEIKEGESVVVINTPEGDKHVEYQIVHNHLVNMNHRTYHKVLDAVKATIDHNNQVYEERIGRLEEDTANFQRDTNERFNNLDSKIDGVKEELDEKIDSVDAKLDKKIDDTKEELDNKTNEVEAGLNAKIDDTKEELNEKINSTKVELDEKIESTKTALEDKIEEGDNALAQNLETAKQELSDSIAAGDQAITERIDNLAEDIKSQNEAFTADIQATNDALNQAKSDLTEVIDLHRSEIDTNIENLGTQLNQTIETVANQAADALMDTANTINNTITEKENALNEKIDSVDVKLDEKIDSVNAKLDEKITTSVDALDKKYDEKTQEISEEVANLTETVEENAKHILEAEGTSYDPATGNITLKARDEENDIVIPMSYDFGTF